METHGVVEGSEVGRGLQEEGGQKSAVVRGCEHRW